MVNHGSCISHGAQHLSFRHVVVCIPDDLDPSWTDQQLGRISNLNKWITSASVWQSREQALADQSDTQPDDFRRGPLSCHGIFGRNTFVVAIKQPLLQLCGGMYHCKFRDAYRLCSLAPPWKTPLDIQHVHSQGWMVSRTLSVKRLLWTTCCMPDAFLFMSAPPHRSRSCKLVIVMNVQQQLQTMVLADCRSELLVATWHDTRAVSAYG